MHLPHLCFFLGAGCWPFPDVVWLYPELCSLAGCVQCFCTAVQTATAAFWSLKTSSNRKSFQSTRHYTNNRIFPTPGSML